MAQDRFVYWVERTPTREEIEHALQDYVGDGVAVVEWRDAQMRWYVSLKGKPSDARRRIDPESASLTLADERWIEVCWDSERINVLTRSQDMLTNAIADGFRAFCLRYWAARP